MTIEQYGKYRILTKLIETPLGNVYRARDDASGQTVGLRVIRGDVQWSPEMRERLKRGCESAASLRHANLVAVLGYGEEPHSTFVITDPIEGRSLESLIADQVALSIEKKISIITQVAEALAYAHDHGVIHQALTPAEIWLHPGGMVQVSGFGCASLLRACCLSSTVQSGTRIYLAPEQIEDKPVDARCDLFPLGLVFYELLTFHHPFQAPETARTLDNILHQISVPTIDMFGDLPLGLWPILERCLAKAPGDRYPSVPEFVAACRQLQRDIADDRQLMLVELHTILPRLAEAAQKPRAPAALKELQQAVEGLLASEQVTEYVPLNRMVSALAEHYRAIHAAFDLPLQPEASEAAAGPAAAAAQAPHATASAPESRPVETVVSPAVEKQTEPTPGQLWGKETQSIVNELLTESPPGLKTHSQPGTITGRGDEIADLLRDIELAHENIRRTVENSLLRSAGSAAPPSPDVDDRDADNPDLAATAPQAEPETNAPVQHEPAAPEPAGQEREETSAAAPAAAVPDEDWFAVPGLTSTEASVPTPPLEEEAEAAGSSTSSRWGGIRLRIRPYARRAALAIIGLFLVVAAGYWVHSHLRTRRGLFVLLSEARTYVAQRLFGSGEPGYNKILAGTQLPSPNSRTSGGEQTQVLDALLEQARNLRKHGRPDESRIFVQRVLELRPEYEPALVELELVNAAVAVQGVRFRQEDPVKKLMANAAALIAAGKLRQAKTELDRIERLEPGLSETQRLLDKWEVKYAQSTQEQDRKQGEQAETARQQTERTQRARRAEELYLQGNYSNVRTLLDEWMAVDPNDQQAQRLQGRTNEALRNLSLYESAMNAKRYQEALDALAGLAQVNPADPSLAELRRRADSRKEAARATLSIYRLREPATLLFDGQPVGTGGEVINQTVNIGTHQLILRTDRGSQVTQTHEFLDGQSVLYVYDASLPILRQMLDSDRSLITERKMKEEVHRIQVEHSHGLLRGSCRGELQISYYNVTYKPVAGTHGFDIPFRDLRLRTEGNTLHLLLAGTNRELAQFRTAEAETAESVAQIWQKLKALER